MLSVKMQNINHLKLICKTNLNKLVVAYLNVNSIRNKFEALIRNVSGKVVNILFYNPHKINISKHIEILSKNLDLYSPQYESIIII